MISIISTVLTILVFIVFVGIVVWAWSSDRKDDFEQAARIPLDDHKPTEHDHV